VEKPGQGFIYYVVGQSGGKTYPNLAKTPWDRFYYDPQDQPDYLVVEFMGDTITIRATKQDGTILDIFSIDKRKGGSAGK
jgi:acid phosphatase type 7